MPPMIAWLRSPRGQGDYWLRPKWFLGPPNDHGGEEQRNESAEAQEA